MPSINACCLWLVSVFAGGLVIGHALDYRINLTSSIDGLVWEIDTDARPVRGDLALVCLPEDFVTRHRLDEQVTRTVTNTCGGIVPLLKRVVGVPGDRIGINDGGITVNHTLLPHTARITSPAVPMERRYILPANKYILAGDTENSLDSRYFGEIDASWITGAARNVL